MQNPQNILITGASSGIGRALAVAYAKPGINLFICARNEKNLLQTKTICENLKANVFSKILNVCDQLASKNWIAEIEENFAIDLDEMLNLGLVHGDINYSNVIFNGDLLMLIDFEKF